MYIIREMEQVLKSAARQFPALIVTGPRQSGKTTLLKRLFSRSHRYVSMDHPQARMMALEAPLFFFENYPPPIILDEIQYTPELFSTIKTLIDKKKELKGQFLITGSQSFPLMSKVSESLAGRMAVFTLLGLSCREQFRKNKSLNLAALKKKVLSGSFPELATVPDMNLQLWFSSYLQTYLERDVRQLRQIGDLTDFQRFLQLLATVNGQIMNLSSLARDLGVAVNTLKAWISILEASGQVATIKSFYLNKGKRIIKSPKVYFLDTGLLCYLSGITTLEQVFQGVASGQMFETLVLGEVMRDFYNRGMLPRVYFWRTSSGEEVDFVLEDKGRIIPLEIKLSSRVNKQMAKGLSSFCSLFQEKVETGLLVTLSGEKLTLDRNILSLPFTDFIKRAAG